VDVVQFNFKAGHVIPGARQLKTPSFRHAMAALSRAALYIGPEGGLHHASGAVGIPAVVIFGGFIPPAVTGYATHTNLTGGAEACGSLHACEHCREAMNAISVPDVMDAANGYLKVAA
jgi:ADP-heptose:LPS heptosyltransferase